MPAHPSGNIGRRGTTAIDTSRDSAKSQVLTFGIGPKSTSPCQKHAHEKWWVTAQTPNKRLPYSVVVSIPDFHLYVNILATRVRTPVWK
jgi:hypothetical protein